jgi:predicted acyl esterase
MAGGRSLNVWTAGRRDQKPREERDDLLVWTSGPLTRDTLIAGEVDTRGRSWNLADSYLRVPDDGSERGRLGPTRRHLVSLGATAAHVARGHRLRLQISSGAHPLHLRNPGTDDPVRDFSKLVASEQRVALGPGSTQMVLPIADVPTP